MGHNKDPQKRKNKSQRRTAKNKAYRPTPPFRTVEGIESPAYDKLHPYSVFVLMEFYKEFNGFNRYDLSLTYKEVKPKMSNQTFNRSIWELRGFGFIDVVRPGRLERNCSIYGLSHRWKKIGSDPPKLVKIEDWLKDIEELKREPGSKQKRERINSLRHRILNI